MTDRDPLFNVSVGSLSEGYPCPKDGAILVLIDGPVPGAWCPTCTTVWAEIADIPLDGDPNQ